MAIFIIIIIVIVDRVECSRCFTLNHDDPSVAASAKREENTHTKNQKRVTKQRFNLFSARTPFGEHKKLFNSTPLLCSSRANLDEIKRFFAYQASFFIPLELFIITFGNVLRSSQKHFQVY
jgi:hypothetical protein